MALDSLLASLKSGVTRVAGVQATHTKEFACNPTISPEVAQVSGDILVPTTATRVTPANTAGVTSKPASIRARTHETPVTPETINCEGSVTEGNPCGAADTATGSRWWLIHFADCDPVEVVCCPEASHVEILERHPEAIAAEPFTPVIRQPSASLTANEERVILAWLVLIEETDPAIIAEVIGQCQRDAEARDYFTGRAAVELPTPDPTRRGPQAGLIQKGDE